MNSHDVSFHCEPLIKLLDTFERDFNRKDDGNGFQIPKYLKSLIHVYFFHDKSKIVTFLNIPKDTIFVHDPQTTIESINDIIRKNTNGFIEKLNPDTEKELKNPNFQHLLLFILYMKGLWFGIKIPNCSFYNQNGEIKTVPFFKLNFAETKVENGRITAYVNYTHSEKDFMRRDDFVHFSRRVKTEEKHFKCAKVYLPEFTCEKIQKIKSNSLINLKYNQNKDGFEAAVALGMVGGCLPPTDELYFNEPFKIEIFSSDVKILEINVNNL